MSAAWCPQVNIASQSNSRTDKITIVYDGECPFCKNYVRLMALRQQVDEVELVDAREQDHPCVKSLRARGLDLNEGMAAIFGDTIYYGSDAVVFISHLSGDGRWSRRFLSRLLREPMRTKFLYPMMKFGRRMALRLLGKPLLP